MKRDGMIFAVLLLLMVCAFGFGIRLILSDRFERGDSYPPCSSFRSDASGTRALYLALDRLSGLRVRRNFTDTSRLSKEIGATWFFLGVDGGVMSRITAKDLKELEDLAAGGNRLVIALSGTAGATGGEESNGKGSCGEAAPSGKKPDEIPLSAWGLAIERIPGTEKPGKDGLRAVRVQGETELPDTVTLHSDICFSADDGLWKTLYTAGGSPVVVERGFGKGSVVMLSDPYPACNRAMKEERHPGLILRLLGGNRTAVFDESHLGVIEKPGLVRLMVKYRLTPFLVGLMILALLYFWKNSVPLVPHAGSGRPADSGIRTDRDALSGLANLLRRNVPRAGLLELCYGEWTRSFSREFPESDGTRVRMKAVVDEEGAKPPAERDPAAGYRRLARIIAERKRK